MIAEKARWPGSRALGGFDVTDGATHPHEDGYLYFWIVDEAALAMGFASAKSRAALPMWLPAVGISGGPRVFFGRVRLNVFNVRMLTMHRWFNIAAAESDPVRPHHPTPTAGRSLARPRRWLPTFAANLGLFGIADQSQEKIDIQASGTGAAGKEGGVSAVVQCRHDGGLGTFWRATMVSTSTLGGGREYYELLYEMVVPPRPTARTAGQLSRYLVRSRARVGASSAGHMLMMRLPAVAGGCKPIVPAVCGTDWRMTVPELKPPCCR